MKWPTMKCTRGLSKLYQAVSLLTILVLVMIGAWGIAAPTIKGNALFFDVASGSDAITLVSGSRINGGNGYWYMDGSGGGRWITLVGLYIGDVSTFSGVATFQSNTDLQGAILNTSLNQIRLYATGGTCVSDGAGLSSVCDGILAAGNTITAGDLKVPVVHGAGTAAKAIESGSGSATAGNLAVTFGTAFGVAPNCNCTDTAAVPVPCGISTAANTTSVTFTAAGTDVVQWICIGTR